MGEPFDVGGEKLLFPGDKSHGASGWNLYNCRCSKTIWDKYSEKNPGMRRARNPVTGEWEVIDYKTYDKYVETASRANPEAVALMFKKAKNESADRKQWEEYRQIVKGAVPETFDKFQDWKYTNPDEWEYTKGLKRYLAKYPESNRKYYDAQQALKEQGINRGVLLPAEKVRAYILPSGKKDPNHIMKRMMKRGITDDEVRSYSDGAKAMFAQWNGERRWYISADGMCVAEKQQDEWVYKTVWKQADYDKEADKIMEVIKNAGL